MGIPFHISLGSFPISSKEYLIQCISSCVKDISTFPLNLQSLGHFNNTVIFVEPEINDALVELHKQFEGNFVDGFSWHPHVTLYIGKEILNQISFEKKTVHIVGIELGEFFPPKIIINCTLEK